MAKLLGERACFNRLDKQFKKMFTEEEQDIAEFSTDVITDQTWEWIFDVNGRGYKLVLNRRTGVITTVTKAHN